MQNHDLKQVKCTKCGPLKNGKRKFYVEMDAQIMKCANEYNNPGILTPMLIADRFLPILEKYEMYFHPRNYAVNTLYTRFIIFTTPRNYEKTPENMRILKTFQKALEFQRKHFGEAHLTFISSYESYCNFLGNLCVDDDELRRCLEDLIEITDKCGGPAELNNKCRITIKELDQTRATMAEE
jgi:hypothetical protein